MEYRVAMVDFRPSTTSIIIIVIHISPDLSPFLTGGGQVSRSVSFLNGGRIRSPDLSPFLTGGGQVSRSVSFLDGGGAGLPICLLS